MIGWMIIANGVVVVDGESFGFPCRNPAPGAPTALSLVHRPVLLTGQVIRGFAVQSVCAQSGRLFACPVVSSAPSRARPAVGVRRTIGCNAFGYAVYARGLGHVVEYTITRSNGGCRAPGV